MSCTISEILLYILLVLYIETLGVQLDPEPSTSTIPPPQSQPSPAKAPTSAEPVVGMTPSTSSAPPPSATAVDEESDDEEEPAQATPGRSLLTEYEGDGDDDAEAD
ncbi:hypothetical protein EV361DRAFT_874566 [Lentinula raphanica]|nr:hypothetical protein EV361DRAFT_874566 [Lentinula raphanica]